MPNVFDDDPGAKAIKVVLEVLQNYGLSEGHARSAVFDMQRKGVVVMVSDEMLKLAKRDDIPSDHPTT